MKVFSGVRRDEMRVQGLAMNIKDQQSFDRGTGEQKRTAAILTSQLFL